MKTSERIVSLLKESGEMTAKVLAQTLQLTTMGVRQHLLALEASGEIGFIDKKAPRGRPTRYWYLTEKSNSLFTNRHEELTVQLIDSVESVFGAAGLDQLIIDREEKTRISYDNILQACKTLAEKVNALAELRSQEGYMAKVEYKDNVYWLLENHCPICAAATKCLSFCRSELSLFQQLFEGEALITREEHIIEGARRCAYKITPNTK